VNTAKSSSCIDIIGSSSVRMLDDSRIAAMLSRDPRGQQPNNFRLPEIIANRGNHSNPTKVIAKRIHTFSLMPGVSQAQFLQQARLRKQE
jgi:hypothetical protein